MEPKKSRIKGRIIWAVLLIVFTYFYCAVYLKPLADEYTMTKGALDMNMERLESIQWLEGQMTVLEEDIDQKNRIITELGSVLPSSKDLTGIIVLLENTADTTGVNLKEILFEDGRRDSKIAQYYTIPIGLRVSGAFGALVSYIAAIEGSGRLLDITDVSLMRGDLPYQGLIEAKIGLCAYAATDDAVLDSRQELEMIEDSPLGRDDPFMPAADFLRMQDIQTE